jgi:hypothetical protein
VQPSVAECRSGIYVATNVVFAMPGAWQLQTTISGPVSDNATPTFQIP